MIQDQRRCSPKEDVWIPSLCYGCYSSCGIKVRRVNGVVVDITPDLDSPHNLGKMCAKGKAGIMSLYDPYRVKLPLRRSNPEKGRAVDPQWRAISWDDALTIIAEKLKQTPGNRLLTAGLDFQLTLMYACFGAAFGAPVHWFGGSGYYCGNALHSVTYMTTGAFYAEPDFDHCQLCLLFGTQLGFLINTNATPLAVRMAEARARGMKVVAIDPVCGQAGSKADQWIPIRPGTDGALALAMLNLLVNHFQTYDVGFLKSYTNASYLIGHDGHYVRDEGSGKPLIWDSKEDRDKPYDDPSLADPALVGEYQVQGQHCQPAFALVKEHLKQYELEKVSRITTIPGQTILDLAEEFGRSAHIGSTIVVDDKELPYRPVACAWNRGAIAHKNAMATGVAIQFLNMVVGAIDVPGGILGTNPVGPFWAPKEGPDGFMVPADTQMAVDPAYPARPVSRPATAEAKELFPVAPYASPLFEHVSREPEKFGLASGGPELLLRTHSNLIFACAQPEGLAESLKKIPLLVSCAHHLDETTDYSDLVLPEAHYLERLAPFPNRPNEHLVPGPGVWYWTMGQPVVEPYGEARSWAEVLLELAYRAGRGPDLIKMLNVIRGLKLDTTKEYSWEEIIDVWARTWFGPEHDLAFFKERGLLITRKKKVEEAYPRPFLKQRVPIYLEHFIAAGEAVAKETEKLGLDWDVSGYQPLPDWHACLGDEKKDSGFDLYVVNYKLPFHSFSFTVQNPWLDELSQRHPWAYHILVNEGTARAKGIGDGDLICLESSAGKVKGQARITQCVHPEVVAVAGTFGHWAEGMPVAKGKGVHFNSLVPNQLERIDPVSAALDCCIKVKIYPEA